MKNPFKKTPLVKRRSHVDPDHDAVAGIASAKVVPDLEIDDDDDDRPADDTSATNGKGGRPCVTDLLPRLVLDAALGAALKRRLKAGKAAAVVVAAPGADWCASLGRAVSDLSPTADVFARDGSSRIEHKSDVGSDKVASALRRGRPVVGISHVPDRYLPATLTTIADARVVGKAPDGRMIRRLVNACVGRAPRAVPDDVASGLGYHDIVGAFRIGASPKTVVALLAAASSSKCRATASDDTPPLDRLPGCDPTVRAWGMALAKDYAAWKRGDLPWKAVDASLILTGPPGTGKTTIAKSLARTLKTTLIATSVGDWFAGSPGYLDSVIKAAQQAFDSAKAVNGVLFIDEIDAIPNRNSLSNRGRDWWLPVITYLLLLLDSAQTARDGAVLLGACNADFSTLDPALVRPGRFGRHIEVLPPAAAALGEVLRHHLGPAVLPDFDLATVARLRPGATPADAAQWARDAVGIARAAGRPVTADDLFAVVAPKDDLSDGDRRRAALHEAGHVLIGVLGCRALKSVSILSVGATGGATTMASGLSTYFTRAEAEAEIAVLLAGRAAEVVFLGIASVGAESDLRAATRLLAILHCACGLGADLVHRASSDNPTDPLAYDPLLRKAIADDLSRIQKTVVETVLKHRAAVAAVAEVLAAKRFLDGAEAVAIVRKALAGPRPKTPGGDGRAP